VISTLDSSSLYIDNSFVATSDAVLQGDVSVGGELALSKGITVGNNITPITNSTSNLGSLTRKYKEVFADVFTGVGSVASILAIAPPTSGSGGIKGQMAFSGTELYICVDTNTWVKMTVTTSF
jgi:hypothetical protein